MTAVAAREVISNEEAASTQPIEEGTIVRASWLGREAIGMIVKTPQPPCPEDYPPVMPAYFFEPYIAIQGSPNQNNSATWVIPEVDVLSAQASVAPLELSLVDTL